MAMNAAEKVAAKHRECELCGKEIFSINKYCPGCKKAVLDSLRSKGYLSYAPTFPTGSGRSSDHRENVRETKFGRD